MRTSDLDVWPTKLGLALISVFLFSCSTTLAQAPARASASNSTPGYYDPLPQDTGKAGLTQELRKLQTTGRLMMVTAHPDDEDGGLLTYEARGKGVQTLLMTLTRGEGGQNKTGDTFSDELGILRTLELLAADRYYGVEQRFSRVADFGFSKSADETFQKWGGHDVPLADIVRVIREFRPDVLIARFSGTDRDGHGHHQASAILTKEAFRAAADPNRFPEQIKEGLQPWQAKKLYIGNVCGFGASTCPDENYTIKINTGEEDHALGMSYSQFAIEGLRHQESQGLGDLRIPPGPRYAFYKLVDSVLPKTTDASGQEKDLFDGIDTTPPSPVTELAAEAAKQLAEGSDAAVQPLEALFNAVQRLANRQDVGVEVRNWQAKVRNHPTSYDSAKSNQLAEKLDESELALRLALGLSLSATVHEHGMSNAATNTLSPGQATELTLEINNSSSRPVTIDSAYVDFNDEISDEITPTKTLVRTVKVKPSEGYSTISKLQVPRDYPSTKPYWSRTDPERENVYSIANTRYATLPFPPAPFILRVSYSIDGSSVKNQSAKNYALFHVTNEVSFPILARVSTSDYQSQLRALAVVPGLSVDVDPGNQVIPANSHAPIKINVKVSSNVDGSSGTLRLQTPEGWKVSPAEQNVSNLNRGQEKTFEFRASESEMKQGDLNVRAVLTSDGKQYSEGYTLVAREDLGSFYYFEPAVQHISIVDVKVPKDLKIGYIMGAGDDIPTVLQQIGMNVTLIPTEKIAIENLSQYGTIILGVRAYDTQKDLVTNNQKLLDFVSNGGTLMVQNNNSIGDFNSEHLTPFPLQLSRARVSVEEAPVQVLDPTNAILHYPNEIMQKDFDGWIQERGLYFADQWDDHFKPLLSCHDPGEPDQKGGMLEAKFGKGTYIFTGYSFFRQLPAGVPGAIRLFVNLASAGHQP